MPRRAPILPPAIELIKSVASGILHLCFFAFNLSMPISKKATILITIIYINNNFKLVVIKVSPLIFI